MQTNNNKEILGVEPEKWSISKWVLSIFGYHFVYPLHILPVIAFLKDHSWLWIIDTIFLYIAYYSISIIFYYIYSFRQTHLFIKYFLGPEKKFTLFKSSQLEAIIENEKNFNYLRSKIILAKKINISEDDFDAISNPINIFYAKSNSGKLLPSCKAYVNILGQVFIVNRTAVPSKNDFETFLINHEIEHINDRGLINIRSNVRSQFLFIVHIILFGLLVNNTVDLLCMLTFILLVGSERFINIEASREIIADNQALLKIKEKAIRLKVIQLLKKTFTVAIQSNLSRFKKIIFIKRLEHMNVYETITSESLQENTPDSESWIFLRTFYNLNNFCVTFGTAFLIYVAKEWYLNPIDFLKIVCLIIVIPFIMAAILSIYSRSLYYKIKRLLKGTMEIKEGVEENYS